MTRQARRGPARPRAWRLFALPALLAAMALVLCAAAEQASAAGQSGERKLVLSPKPGKKYQSHPVPLRVRAHRHDRAVARLNGVRTVRELERVRGGMRRIGLSAGHGLRHGRNVLRVRVRDFHSGRVRTRTIRFRVVKDRPLAAAGRDRRLSPQVRFRLDGRKSRLPPAPRAKRLRYRWKVLSRPKRFGLRRGRHAKRNRRAARPLLRRARSARPIIRPRMPGVYRLGLRVVGPAGKAGTDRVKLTVDPPPALRVKTMARDSQGRWGIRVGDDFYPAKPGSWLQVVVLDRSFGTLRSNRSYDCPSSQGTGWKRCARTVVDDLGRPKDAIVIASNQPDVPGASAAPHGAAAALVALGVPNQPFPAGDELVRGTYSAIGTVGGPSTGRTATSNEPGAGSIEGLLIRNNRLNYAFSSPDRVTFDTQAPGSTERVNVIRVGDTEYRETVGRGGFHLVVVDRRTLAGSSYWFETHGKKGHDAYRAISGLRNNLASAHGADKIVFLASRGQPVLDAQAYDGLPVSAHAFYREIAAAADAIWSLGGTRTAFYKLIDPGLYNNPQYFPHNTYTLVGRRSGPGRGEEGYGPATSSTPTLNGLPLGGTLARTTDDYGYAVDQTFNEDPAGAHAPPRNPAQRLIEVVHGPDTPWPGEGDKGRAAAIAWIGAQVGLTNDPRAQYYTRPYTTGSWTQTQKLIRRLKPGRLPADVTAGDFKWAREQLIQEIDWLQAAHSYVATLAAPYAKTSMQSWADLQSIATSINTQVRAGGDDKAFMVVGAIFDGLRSMAEAIPGVGEAFTIANALYDTGLRIAEVTDGTDDPDTKFPTTVAKAGSDLADRLRDAEDTLTVRMAAVIASDYKKLRTVAQCGLGLSSCPVDPAEWQLTSDQQTRIGQGLQATLRNTFYSTLLPAKYTLWRIPVEWPAQRARYWVGHGVVGAGSFYPFSGLPPSAEVFIPSCRDMGDHANRDQWRVYALGARSGNGDVLHPYTMDLPKQSVTDPVLAPVDPSRFPAGGLGNSAEAFYLRYFPQAVIDHYPLRDSPMNWDWPRETQYSLCSQ